MSQEGGERNKKNAKTPIKKSNVEEAKEVNLEQEGRLRFKVLTNFLNAYKDKMFLSNYPGRGDDEEGVMTLEELKKKT